MRALQNRNYRRWIVLCAVGVVVSLVMALQIRAQQVAITIDDLPSHGALPSGTTRVDVTRAILAALKSAHVPQVYGFVNAGRLEKNPEDLEVLKMWREAGQPLGNHTYTHMNFNENTPEAFEENIEKNEPTLKLLMGGANWHWFRYPYLWEGDTVEKRHVVRSYLANHGYHIAQVTLDFEDYAWNGPYARCVEKKDEKAIAWLKESYLHTAREYMDLDRKMARQVFHRNIKYVLLMHVGAFDALMLPDLLQQMKKQGFRFVTLEKAESDRAYQVDPDAALKNGGTLLDQFFDSRHLQYPPHAEKPMKQLAEICK